MVLKRPIHASHVLNEPIEYQKSFSRGMRVEMGEYSMLFISGTASVDEKGESKHSGDLIAQVKRVFSNIAALLVSEAASWHDVVQTRCYLKNMRSYYLFNEYRNYFYKQQKLASFPASVCVQAALCRPELLVEIEAIAIIRTKKNNSKSQRKNQL